MQIIDNINTVLGEDLRAEIKPGAKLRIAAATFSIYAFEALRRELSRIEELEFIFTTPSFTAADVEGAGRQERRQFFIPEPRPAEASLYGTEFEIRLRNKLTQRAIARECAALINEQKATVIVEHVAYDVLDQRHDTAIFTEDQTKVDFAKAGEKLERHIYDYVVTDSQIERKFVTKLDTSTEVAVYAKLPRGFLIPTPVGDYNPDWAIAFKEGTVKHVYFVAETKGSLSSLKLRPTEQAKIDCARRFFAQLKDKTTEGAVTYGVVTSFGELMNLVGTPPAL
jgi:type III restriction enzyme